MFPLKNDLKGGAPIATLPANWFNTVANILNDIEGVGIHIEKPAGGQGYGWKIVSESAGAAVDALTRFKVEDQGGGTIRVRVGNWTRNGQTVVVYPDLDKDYKTISGVGSDSYVYLELIGENYDPALAPGIEDVDHKLQVSHGASHPDDKTDFGIYWILGKFTSGTWAQWWLGDIDDWVFRPDGNSWSESGAVRKTLQINEETPTHYGEGQLYDVQNVRSNSFSMPYFHGNIDVSAMKPGFLEWACIDNHEGDEPNRHSLEVKNAGTGSGYFQIYDFDTADDQKVPVNFYYAPPERTLTWKYIVTYNGQPQLTGSGAGPGGDGSKTVAKIANDFSSSPMWTYPSLVLPYKVFDLVVGDGRLEVTVAETPDTNISLDLSHSHGSGEVPSPSWNASWCEDIQDCEWYGGFTGTINFQDNAGQNHVVEIEDGLVKSWTYS